MIPNSYRDIANKHREHIKKGCDECSSYVHTQSYLDGRQSMKEEMIREGYMASNQICKLMIAAFATGLLIGILMNIFNLSW